MGDEGKERERRHHANQFPSVANTREGYTGLSTKVLRTMFRYLGYIWFWSSVVFSQD